MFALASRSVRAIASPTSSGTCDPPGASRNTKPSSRSEEKRARTASTSNRVAAMERAYPRVILGGGNFGGIGSAPAFFERGDTLEQALELMDAAWNKGITWFDTADAYGGGRGPGPRAGPGAAPDRHEPPAARRRSRRPLSLPRLGRRRTGGGARGRARGARRRRKDRRLRR